MAFGSESLGIENGSAIFGNALAIFLGYLGAMEIERNSRFLGRRRDRSGSLETTRVIFVRVTAVRVRHFHSALGRLRPLALSSEKALL